MYIPRSITPHVKEALRQFPVVLLTGPRQSGKTEILKHEFSDYAYFSLDALDVRQKALQDPRSFFSASKNIIIDEIQEVPELLSYIKEEVDRDRRPGRILLTGSHQFHLMKGVTESLAGRVAILELLPFSWSEIFSSVSPVLGEILLRGMYPQVQTSPDLNLDLWFSSYIHTYVQRDLRSQIAIKDLRAFEVLLQLLAARIGQELNLNRLASEVGANAMTIKSWISALEAAYIVYLLPPYFRNFGKRLVKSPKIYFMDTGIICHLTRILQPDFTLSGPLAGALFENFVIIEYLKKYRFQAREAPLYFWRSHDGLEVDLIIDQGSSLEAVECKLSQTVTSVHVPNLLRLKAIAQLPVTRLTVVSPSVQPALGSELTHRHWSNIAGE